LQDNLDEKGGAVQETLSQVLEADKPEDISWVNHNHGEAEVRGLEELPNNRWLGVVASGRQNLTTPNGYDLSRRFRKSIYVDELGWASSSDSNPDYEEDEHDEQSTHVALIDFDSASEAHQISAHVRYIHRSGNTVLPVEDEFSLTTPLEQNSLEVSRLISRHPNRRIQMLGSVLLVSHTIGTLHKLQATGYATIEKKLLRMVSNMGMSVERITEPKVLAEYGDTSNFAVRIDATESLKRAKELSLTKANFPYYRLFDIATQSCDAELLQEAERILNIEQFAKAA
jgi:N-acyl-L-homoserine lactone synthetase